MQAYISGCSGTCYKNTTSTHKGCWWNYFSYFMFKYAEQCCVSIYYSNFFLFPSCHSCSYWNPKFEHIGLLFPFIWHITLIFLSCPKVFKQIWLDAKIGSMIDIWVAMQMWMQAFILHNPGWVFHCFFFSWVYIWQLKCYVKLVIIRFPLATGNERNGGICATTYMVKVSSMYRIGNY